MEQNRGFGLQTPMPQIYFGKSLKTIYSMDFIKTTSPWAPSELAFQCNWIHIIWMSRKGVMIDLVKTGPDGSNRELASRPYGTADRGTSVPRAANVRTHPSSHLNARRAHVPTREASTCGRPIRSPATLAAHDRTARAGGQCLTTVRHNTCHTHDPSVRSGRPRLTYGRMP
ncbi:unnamed protein product [Microthlaspi erraticum]|uniref:Uncharacterized protein n=1 Tax=Microthlaspi erraticum TaxID=1685480 RepID=A0A6D2ITU2_9BRAS|nr:unnamed protein product [Microthlaspi erraticum]